MRLSPVGLVATLAIAFLVVPLAVDAQPKGHVPRIGWVGGIAPTDPSPSRNAFQEGLQEMGYVEGQHVIVERRYSGHPNEGFAPLIADLLRLPVDVLVTATQAAALAAREATSTTPIVFTNVSNPVELGLITSLARPGGNMTGIASFTAELFWQRSAMLKEVVPGLTRMAVLWNPSNPAYPTGRKVVEATPPPFAVHLHVLEVRDPPTELAGAFAAMVREGAEAVHVGLDGVFFQHCRQIAELAVTHRLPAVYGFRQCVEAGGLMSYAVSQPDRLRRVGVLVGKILKGAKPADLPVEQPMRFELVINLKTAKALGITVPPALLILADEVIQ